ncbi:unnamed protein product [Adineta ricciae]|uniref:Uncharacterized protein n=1 Tax=Adineta ricciae TaxID=249248 RepID=A0A815HNX7_ADIRI|nr:unnamed protein product [Adineta ricciae]
MDSKNSSSDSRGYNNEPFNCISVDQRAYDMISTANNSFYSSSNDTNTQLNSMDLFLNVLSHLQIRFYQGYQSQSNDCTPTAVFQIVTKETNTISIESDPSFDFQFEACYECNGQFYPHPYRLQSNVNRSAHYTLGDESYEISLFLELKRLRDFEDDDLRRYYQTIDSTVDQDEEVRDFHDVYINLHYMINGERSFYRCNNGRSIQLPTLVPNPWTSKNTLTRFRYKAEQREGALQCEMKLRLEDIAKLQSFRIVLCLTSNTIPARMDYHALRWTCKLKTKVGRQSGASARTTLRETVLYLSHPSGIIVANVYGSELIFTPKSLDSINRSNYVRSYCEPKDFQKILQDSDLKDNGALAVLVTKGTEYPEYMRSRRKSPNIRRYLPFSELDNLERNLGGSNNDIIKILKSHREQRGKQLVFFNNDTKRTYSQAHVRMYVAAYDENDILLAETLHPPLRNSKAFESLRIMRIVQPRRELRAKDSAYVYCNYDFNQSKTDYVSCPFQFELVFMSFSNTPDDGQLLKLFEKPHVCAEAHYVTDCPCLLQFTIPNEPNFHEHRVFIRLRHTQSNDYNSSSISLTGRECWIYYADSMAITDLSTLQMLSGINDSSTHNASSSDHVIELQIQSNSNTLSQEDLSHSPQESDEEFIYPSATLNTPDPNLPRVKRFAYTSVLPYEHDSD